MEILINLVYKVSNISFKQWTIIEAFQSMQEPDFQNKWQINYSPKINAPTIILQDFLLSFSLEIASNLNHALK